MIKNRIKEFGPLFILALMSLVLIWQNFERSPWVKKEIIRSDVANYYTYLPATFIHKDPLFENSEFKKARNYRTFVSPIGRNAVKMSMGVAMMDVPFFYIGHLYALSSDKYEANGYSVPYHFAISFSSVFYTIFGLIFLWLVLKRSFSELSSLITVLLIAFGTNLFYYSIYETGYSHNCTFFLLSVFLYVVQNWLSQKRMWTSILLGILLGLIVLVRPINILFILPVLFLLKGSEVSWNIYLKKLFLPFSFIIPIIFGGVLVVLPQLLFWKFQTGSLFSYSYGKEGFFWMNPHIWEGLFSFRKGWFIYTPLMLFACFGLLRLFKTHRMHFWSLIVFLPIFFYVTFSWWCWWYGGSFGARTLIDILPFMAFPLAALITWFGLNKWRYLILVIPGFFVYLNIFQSWQYSRNIIHFDSMNWEAYRLVFLEERASMKSRKIMVVPDYENAVKFGVEKVSNPLVSDDPESPVFKQSVREMMDYIKTDEEWMESIREKASNENISIDSAMQVTAIWVLKQE